MGLSSRKLAIAGAVAVVLIGAGVHLETKRRRELAAQFRSAVEKAVPADEGPSDLTAKFSDASRFLEFCRKVNDKYLAMNKRYKSSQHRRRQRSRQVDSEGKASVDEEFVALVDFPNGKERQRVVEQSDRLTGKKVEGVSALQKDMTEGRKEWVYAFSPEGPWDDFTYEFGGVEMLDGKAVVKVVYTPKPPFGLRMAGTVWADAETGQPMKFAGRAHKPSFPVDKYEIAVVYGPSENGHPQIRTIEIDGAGGFLFISKRYLISIAVDDYRKQESP